MRTSVLTQTAKDDLERIALFLEETQSSWTKIRFLNAFSERLLRLEQMPFMYQASDKDPDVRRCLIHQNAACFYRVTDTLVIILSIVDTRMNPDASLF
jgi:plasmid stabilization system protein ParE